MGKRRKNANDLETEKPPAGRPEDEGRGRGLQPKVGEEANLEN